MLCWVNATENQNISDLTPTPQSKFTLKNRIGYIKSTCENVINEDKVKTDDPLDVEDGLSLVYHDWILEVKSMIMQPNVLQITASTTLGQS